MNRDFVQVNNSLPQQIFEQCKLQFQQGQGNLNLSPLSLTHLPHFLEKLKLSIPQPMMKDYLKCLQEIANPQMTFKQFTHYVARASLQQQVQDELRNLFYFIDKEESGTIDARDLCVFIKQLDGGSTFSQKDIDCLMKELDQKQMGFLSYEDFVYGLLPK